MQNKAGRKIAAYVIGAIIALQQCTPVYFDSHLQ